LNALIWNLDVLLFQDNPNRSQHCKVPQLNLKAQESLIDMNE